MSKWSGLSTVFYRYILLVLWLWVSHLLFAFLIHWFQKSNKVLIEML